MSVLKTAALRYVRASKPIMIHPIPATETAHPTDTAMVVRCSAAGRELVSLRWGFKAEPDAHPVINIRAETAHLSSHRCLVPATEFFLFTGVEHPKRRWRVTVQGEELFFFAGLWREAADEWPESYAILTTEAAPDLQSLADRQMAVILPRDAAEWLSDEIDVRALLTPLPNGSYVVEETTARL